VSPVNSSITWAYVFSVIAGECPAWAATSTTLAPSAIKREQNECRRSYGRVDFGRPAFSAATLNVLRRQFTSTLPLRLWRERSRDSKDEPRQYLRGHNRRNTGLGWLEQGRWYVQVDGKEKAFHRHLMETVLGRELRPDEIVHHADHDPLNNDPANLVVLSRSEHLRIHSRAGRPPRWTELEKARLIELRQAGMTIQDCSVVLDRPYSGTQAQLEKATKEAKSPPTIWEDKVPEAA
jgi:hypothetical protein